jgi:hypothetical protein
MRIANFSNNYKPIIKGTKLEIIHSRYLMLMDDRAVTFAQELNVPLVFTFFVQYENTFRITYL